MDGLLPREGARVSNDPVFPHEDGDVGAWCYDCGRAYGTFPDLLVSNAVWGLINPSEHEGGGILCPACISNRCARRGLTDVYAAWASGPLVGSPYYTGFVQNAALLDELTEALRWLHEMAGYAQHNLDDDWASRNGRDFRSAIDQASAALNLIDKFTAVNAD